MRIRFLGTGTSTGVPEIGCKCKVCTSTDKRDSRLRTSVLVETDSERILLDCGPDFRQQVMSIPFAKIDGVLITHEHYDHVGGIDDLRPFCRFGNIDIYAEEYVCTAIKMRIPYCFTETPYPGVPKLTLKKVDVGSEFYIGGQKIVPIRVMHGKLPILGFRIGNMAYLTDVKTIPETEFEKLHGLDLLIIDALRYQEHMSHENVDEALENVARIAPEKTCFIHMSHDIGLHEESDNRLPDGITLSYDGLTIEI